MNISSLRNISVIGLGMLILVLFGSAYFPKSSCENPIQPAAVAFLTSSTSESKHSSGSDSDSIIADRSEQPSGSVFDSMVADQSEPYYGPVSDSINPEVIIPDTTDADGYRVITFNDLAEWEYIYPENALNTQSALTFGMLGMRRIYSDAPLEDRLPDPIMALDSQQVSVTGFMMPITSTREGVTKFILVRNMMICCYGVVPKMNEWIYVQTAESEPVQYYRHIPVRVRGRFRIDEQVASKDLVQLFTMTANDLEISLPSSRKKSDIID